MSIKDGKFTQDEILAIAKIANEFFVEAFEEGFNAGVNEFSHSFPCEDLDKKMEIALSNAMDRYFFENICLADIKEQS